MINKNPKKIPYLLFFITIYSNCLLNVFCDRVIGAICDDGTFLYEATINVALATISEGEGGPLVPKVVRTSPGDILETEDAICSLLKENVYGIFGPTKKDSILHVQSMTDNLEIPQIINQAVETQNRNWSAVNLYPHHISYSQLFTDLIAIKGWTEFTIIYEGSELLPFLENIFTMQDLSKGQKILMNVVQLPDGDDFRAQLKTIKKSGSVNFILDCSLEYLSMFLEQAQQVGIMSDQHSYIIMNPDFQTIDVNAFKHGGSNITGIRFFDPSLEYIQKFVSALNEKVVEISEGQADKIITENGLTFDLALLYDAVTIYGTALNALALQEGANITCDKDEGWEYGSTIINYIRTMEIDGLTGTIKFDDEGFRSYFEVDVLELMSHGLEKVGSWNIEDGFVAERNYIPPAEEEGSDSMKGKHFIVITALSAPYGMLKESSKRLEGNDRYEGFGIDLIEELARMNEFNYTFELQADGVYGAYDPKTKEWNGMMKKIMDGTVDFGITDLTITSTRQKAVDFTSPFMTLGITILYKKPTKEPPDLFSFILPFSPGVWSWLAGAFVGVSVLLFILGRLAPEEWQNPYPCIEEPETLDNQFSLANSFWFTLGSVLTQGSEIAPIAVSTRMAGSAWWFFTLIMVSSYTANLAVFLTVQSKFYEIKSVQDLANNPYGITYGAKKNGATFSFFMESDNLLYQQMYRYMADHPELQTATNDEGLEWVKSKPEKYAFLMESISIEYMVERNCDVAQAGSLLDNKGYGIAMKKNSPYRQPMSESILQLQEDGTLTKLKNKWWKERRGGGACEDDDAGTGEAQPLVLENVGGAFIVLVAGSALAIICAIFEMVFDIFIISRKYRLSFKQELTEELRFILSFSGDTKTVRHRELTNSSTPSLKNDEEDKNGEMESLDENKLDPAPTPHSERSSHSHHTLHSRRTSNAVQIAKMRKYSKSQK